MASTKLPRLRDADYEAYARDYLRDLPPEHFMEAIGQSTQREITLESLALVKARRSDFHVFNEMLVQYPRPGKRKPGQVCPDNMVVLSDQPPGAKSSYDVRVEPAHPFWVLEYVSRSNKRKDYLDNFDKYEKELKVPYYLTFYPEDEELRLYRFKDRRYETVKENRHGRYAIRELKLEVALLDGWVRFWFQGELLPLPAELQRNLKDALRRADEEKRRADDMQRRFEEEHAARQALERELAQLRAIVEQQPGRRNNGNRPER